MIYDHYKILGL